MKTLILGMGNTLFGDDGLGITVAYKLKKELDKTPHVDILETTMGGLEILDLITGYDKAIIIDAIKTGQNSFGTIYKLTPQDLGNVVKPYNLHALDLNTALELGKKAGYKIPEQIYIYAVEIKENTTIKEGLSPKIKKLVPLLVDKIVTELQIDI